MKKLYFTLFIFICTVSNICSQTYIMSTSTANFGYAPSFIPNGQYFYQYWIKANGNYLYPIKAADGYLIFDQKPTSYYFSAYRPESYSCSGPCGEEWNSGLSADNFDVNCYSISGGSGGYGGVEIFPAFSIISNQVLVSPGVKNNFCDKINLQATGCTGTQRFYWEYKIEGGSFQKTNISTAFNQTFQFDKLSYLPESYIGNIDFRVLIDSDTNITGEEVYSNIISYYIIPCPPFLKTAPAPTQTSCVYSSDGKVMLTFNRDLVTNEVFEFSFFKSDGPLLAPPPMSIDTANKQYTFSNLPQGDYYIKYQTSIGTQKSDINPEPYPAFTIAPPSQFKFEVTTSQPSCHGDDGIIIIKASGGTTPYYYTIDTNPEVEFTTSTAQITVSEGDHAIKVRDTKSCIDIEKDDKL